MNTKQIRAALRKRYQPPEWVFIEELRFGTGFASYREPGWSRTIDAYAINCYPSRMRTIAFEIKVSRSDFFRELGQPEKREPFLKVSNEFYFVTPHGLVEKDEIPEGCGLIEVFAGHSRIKVKADKVPCPNPPWRFVASLTRRLQEKNR